MVTNVSNPKEHDMPDPDKPTGYAWTRVDDDGGPTGSALYVGPLDDRAKPVVAIRTDAGLEVLGTLRNEDASRTLIECLNGILKPTRQLVEAESGPTS